MKIRIIKEKVRGTNRYVKAFLYPFDTEKMTIEEFSKTDDYREYMALGAPDLKPSKLFMLKNPEFPKKLEDSVYTVCPEEVKSVINRCKRIDSGEIINQGYLRNIVILHGTCGTGKSEFVPLIARKTNRKLVFINSGFLGNFYSDSERVNLKEAVSPLAKSGTPCVVGIEDVECLETPPLELICKFARAYPNILFVLTTIELNHIEKWFFNLVNQYGKMIYAPLPNQNARRHILNYLLSDRKSNYEVSDSVVKKTAGFSIRGLEAIVREAGLKILVKARSDEIDKESLWANLNVTDADVEEIKKKAMQLKCFRDRIRKYRRENSDDNGGEKNNKTIIMACCIGILLAVIISYLYLK